MMGAWRWFSGSRRVGAPPANTIPPPLSIHVAPSRRSLTLAVIGDFGRSYKGGVDRENSRDVARLVHCWSPDYVLTTGDNNYPEGSRTTMAVNLDPYRRYIQEGRFLPALGNHDWGCHDCPAPHLEQFGLPGNGRYYCHEIGVLVVWVLDSDEREPHGITEHSTQALWLRQGLNRCSPSLNLVILHHPPYSSGHHGSSEHLRWPFAAWGADAVFAGHEHSYERLHVDGIPYFVNGSGGADLRNFQRPLPSTRLRYAARHGAQRILFDGKTATIEFWNTRGYKIDAVSVPRR